MKPEFIEDRVAKQAWVGPADTVLESISRATLRPAGSLIRRFLHGTWLGHALHPAVISAPIGAFATASVLDLAGELKSTRKFEPGADAAVGFGLACSALAVASGLADWSKTDGDARRVGVLHAACNGSATLCYIASWLLRRRGDRRAGVSTGLLGLVFLSIGGWLGGRLVSTHRISVDHAERTGPEDFHAVFPVTELPDDEPHRAEVNGVGVLVVKRGGHIYAIGEKCAHLGGPLSEGKLEGDAIRCPWHGSKFDLHTGEVLDGPSAFPQPCWEARIREGMVEVRFVKKA